MGSSGINAVHGDYSFKLYSDKMFPIFIAFLLASCLSNVDCQRPPCPPSPPPPPPPQYPTPSPVQDYNPDIGQTNVGGNGVNKDPYCHKVEKVIFKNKCEPYKENTCWTQNEEICEKFSNIFPFPVEKQNCHFEPKKICELEMKTRPKKAKKYSYTKDCKEQPREICDQ